MSKPINWLRIFDQHGIEYVERGANVKRGNVNIRCAFCGTADPSHHMGVDLTSGWWGCWRNQNHRGKSPVRLLVRLLNISYYRACEIAGINDSYVDPDGFDAVAARIMGRENLQRMEEVKREVLAFDRNFKDITDKGATQRAWQYLLGRGFTAHAVDDLCSYYHVSFAIAGDFKDRVILPFYFEGELVAWTARAIAESKLRYKDLSLADCLIPPKETLFNHDCILDRGRHLIVTEGPIDALKVDVYGRRFGVRSVALATNSISDEQIYLLEEASPRFLSIKVMMDNANSLGVVDSMRMKERMTQIKNLKFVSVPGSYKDAGEMPVEAVENFCRSLT